MPVICLIFGNISHLLILHGSTHCTPHVPIQDRTLTNVLLSRIYMGTRYWWYQHLVTFRCPKRWNVHFLDVLSVYLTGKPMENYPGNSGEQCMYWVRTTAQFPLSQSSEWKGCSCTDQRHLEEVTCDLTCTSRCCNEISLIFWWVQLGLRILIISHQPDHYSSSSSSSRASMDCNTFQTRFRVYPDGYCNDNLTLINFKLRCSRPK